MFYLKADRYDSSEKYIETLFIKRFEKKFEALDFVENNYILKFGMRKSKIRELCLKKKMFFSYPKGFLDDNSVGTLGFRLYSKFN